MSDGPAEAPRAPPEAAPASSGPSPPPEAHEGGSGAEEPGAARRGSGSPAGLLTDGLDLEAWNPAPRAASLLLEPGDLVRSPSGYEQTALGTGVVPIAGTARSGKTALALALMAWTCENTSRPFALMGLPPEFLEALPEPLRSRCAIHPLEALPTLRDAVVLCDDSAVLLNSRDAGTSLNRMLNRVAGVISHLGLTLLVTVQSMAGVDLALLRYCEMAPLVKRIDPLALEVERSEWAPRLREAQVELAMRGFDRSLHWSVADDLVCWSPLPGWLDPEVSPEGADRLSRPFRYLDPDHLTALVGGQRGGST